METANYHVYVGSYSDASRDGIFLYEMDADNGKMTYLNSVAGWHQPSFLTIDHSKRFLYAISEVEQYGEHVGGAVAAYRIDETSGALTLLNEQPTKGGLSCHVSIDEANRRLFMSNYSGGSIAMFPVESDGSLGPICDFIQHEGKGVNEDRQEGPHPHSVFLYQNDRYVFVPDLGLDKVFIYLIDYEAGKYKLHGEAKLPLGAGPRHLTFHPSLAFVYVVNELDSTVSVFSIDPTSCVLHHIQNISTLPQDYQGISTCADIHITPNGKFLYASNRGHDSLAIYRVGETDGLLTATGISPTYGETPRNFAITPNGKFVIAANQDSNNLYILAIDAQTGHLTVANAVNLSTKPVCIKIVER